MLAAHLAGRGLDGPLGGRLLDGHGILVGGQVAAVGAG